jgi:hypothetical protein
VLGTVVHGGQDKGRGSGEEGPRQADATPGGDPPPLAPLWPLWQGSPHSRPHSFRIASGPALP